MWPQLHDIHVAFKVTREFPSQCWAYMTVNHLVPLALTGFIPSSVKLSKKVSISDSICHSIHNPFGQFFIRKCNYISSMSSIPSQQAPFSAPLIPSSNLWAKHHIHTTVWVLIFMGFNFVNLVNFLIHKKLSTLDTKCLSNQTIYSMNIRT